MIRSWMHDAGAALRGLGRHKAFAATALATLALGIGANTAIMSAVRGVLFRPLPYADGDRLVHLFAFWPGGWGNMTFPDSLDIAERSRTLEAVAAYQSYGSVALTGRAPVRNLATSFVTPSYFEILGVRAALGRLFTREDDADASARAAVVLSDAAWARDFGSDPGVVGRTLHLNGMPFEVIGVLPDRFADLGALEGPRPDVFLPTAMSERLMGQPPRTGVLRLYWGLGRLKPGVTLAQASDDLTAIAGQIEREKPDSHRGYGLRAQSLSERIRGGLRAPTLALWAGSLFLLLIGCANVANLLLLRLAERRRELSLRAALGASAPRLFRLVFVEAVVLAGLGATLGTLIGLSLSRILSAWSASHVSSLIDLSLDPVALVAAVLISFSAVLAVALIPARDAARASLGPSLGQGRGLVADRAASLTRNILMASEVTFAILLLVGAGLMARSFQRITSTPLGFDTDRLLTFRLDLGAERYREPDARVRFVDEFLERVRAMPGVESATVWGPSMLGRATWVINVAPQGARTDRPGDLTMLFRHSISPGGLATLGIPKLSGREFTVADDPRAPLVGIISESAARHFWPGQDPVGRQLIRGSSGLPPITVIGVARDVLHRERYSFQEAGDGFIGGLGPQRDLYLPYAQRPNNEATFAVRVRTGAGPITATIQKVAGSLDPDLPLGDPRFLEDRIEGQERQPRALAGLLLLGASLAAALAATGIYGVIAHAVGRRTREIGLRVALGARRVDILLMVLGQGLGPVALGTLIGLAGSMVLGQGLRSILFDVKPVDPATFAGVAVALAVVATAATIIPARRALSVDPTVALKEE